MTLTVEQELDLYTAVEVPKWLAALPEYQSEPVAFLFKFRGRWQFTTDQLRRHLAANPELVESYFRHCKALIGAHEKVILVRDGAEYVVLDQDRGNKKEIHRFTDQTEAVLKWLTYRYLN